VTRTLTNNVRGLIQYSHAGIVSGMERDIASASDIVSLPVPAASCPQLAALRRMVDAVRLFADTIKNALPAAQTLRQRTPLLRLVCVVGPDGASVRRLTTSGQRRGAESEPTTYLASCLVAISITTAIDGD
jgi:hypothetical protein